MSINDPGMSSTPISNEQMRGLVLQFLKGIETDDWLPILAGAMQRHDLPPYRMLYRQDTPVAAIYILAGGRISQYREDMIDGKRVRSISRTVGEGKLLGHLEFLFGNAYSTNARSEDLCQLLSIEIHAFSRLVYHFPQIRDRLFPKNIADRLSTFPFMRSLMLPVSLHPIVSGFLADETNPVPKAPDQPIYRSGDLEDRVFLIHEGQVKIEQSGHPGETRLLGNGAMFGAAHTTSGFIGLGSIDRQMVHGATAQTNTQLYTIPYHSFKSITGLDPDIAIRADIALREQMIEQLPVFTKVTPEIRKTIAGFVSHSYFPNSHLIVQQGEVADSLWVLVKGRAAIRALDREGSQLGSALAIGPTYFAEQALLGQIPQESTVEAQPESEWLRFHWRDLETISKLHSVDLRSQLNIRSTHGIKPMVEESEQQKYEWLEPGEQVIIRTRRHWIAFLRKMLPAFVVLLIFLAGFWFADFLPGTQYFLRALLIILLVIDGLAIVWGTIDYFNDWLAITDLRVVHQEKVLFINEWRKQAPLEQIQNVDFSTNWLGKILNYGTLTIATAATVGTITFDYSTGFSQLRSVIMKQREQRRRSTTAASKMNIHRMLESRLGIAIDIPSRVYHGGAPSTEQPGLRKRLSKSVDTRLRREQDGRIIWRKHWLVLLPRLWFPLLVFTMIALL
ncbi:MAG: cyclic nucleotide-binding domain-containing protein, partial [Caldilinea sp.]